MNCCNDHDQFACAAGKPAAVARASRYTCDELGVCQERVSRCGGCFTKVDTAGMTASIAHGHAFAPGAVEAYKAPLFGSPSQRRQMVRAIKAAALWMAVCGAAGFAAGVVAGVWP